MKSDNFIPENPLNKSLYPHSKALDNITISVNIILLAETIPSTPKFTRLQKKELTMMKSFKIFVFLLIAGSVPAIAMEKETSIHQLSPNAVKRRELHKAGHEPLRKVILKREGRKAALKQDLLSEENYIKLLYAKYETTKEQGLPLRRITRLSEAQKSKLLESLTKRNRQLFQKFVMQHQQMTKHLDIARYSTITSTLIQSTMSSQPETTNEIVLNGLDFMIYSQQECRRSVGAIIWANEEFIKEKENYDI